MANTTIRALTTLSGANVADTDLFILHDFSANTEVSVTPVALATALNSRIGNVGSANGITISASSTNTALTITQTGTGDALRVEDSASPDSTPFIVKSDGLVGIGTATPTNALHVVTSAYASGITLENTGEGADVAPRLMLYRNSASPANTDIIGSVFFTGNSTSANNIIYGRITGHIDDVTTSSENGRITIETRRDGYNTTAMVFGGTGRIRIGPTATEPTNAILGIDRAINYNVNGNFGVLLEPVISYDTNGSGTGGFISSIGTQAATFTVTSLRHYIAQEGTIGAGSTITSQTGFQASSNMITATDNYGFQSLNATAITPGKNHYAFHAGSDIATGGGNAWNFYASGAAPNYFAGVTQFADGTAATPSITNIGDTNTGMFFPAADTIAFSTNGTVRVTVDSSGNINVGTGTARAQLHVSGAGQTTAALTDAGARGGMLRLSDNRTTAGSGGAILFTNSTGDTANSAGFAAIKGLLVSGVTNTTGDLAFSTRAHVNDVALTERMRLSASGALGIGGTAGASAILDVQSTTRGFLPPRMTTAQRDAIATPAAGLTVYNTTTSREEGYDGAQWIPRIPLNEDEDRVINGGFDIWQRGTSSTAVGYVADRWINAYIGGTVTLSRQSFTLGITLGKTLGPNNPQFFLRQSVTGQTLASQFAHIIHRIEGVRSYAGQTITVLGWAKRASGTGNMALEGFQIFGTGGTPSADVQVTAVGSPTITLGTMWAPFAITMNVPSISPKTIGTNNDDYFALNFFTSAGSDFNARTNSLGLQTIEVDMWGVHVRVGTWTANDALLYRQKDIQSELDKCYRYYYRVTASGAQQVLAAGYNTSTTVGRFIMHFPVRMRIAPTALEQTGTAANYGVFNAATITECTGVPTYQTSTQFSGQVTATTGATLVAGQGSILASNAANAYLAWSAEL